MPKWIKDRAERIAESTKGKYGEKEGKQVAFALATLQAHKTGKTPKGFGTAEGRKAARKKYTEPRKEYKKTASEVVGDVLKQAGLLQPMKSIGKGLKSTPFKGIGAAVGAPPKVTGLPGVSIKSTTGIAKQTPLTTV